MASQNDLYKTSKTGNKKNLLTLNLEGVIDRYVREAFENVGAFVRELVSGGFTTEGVVRARGLMAGNEGFQVKIFEDTVAARDAGGADKRYLQVDGAILSVDGYAQVGGGAQWEKMQWGTGHGVLMPYWYAISNGNTDRSVGIRNLDTVNANNYRVVIIYKDDTL